MARGGITWTERGLFNNLESAPEKFQAAMVPFTNFWARRCQDHMQENAPWTDRTGNARQGLKARPESRAWQYSIILAHTMPYGIYLETRWGGKYAIILPTIKTMGREVMAGAREILRRMN